MILLGHTGRHYVPSKYKIPLQDKQFVPSPPLQVKQSEWHNGQELELKYLPSGQELH